MVIVARVPPMRRGMQSRSDMVEDGDGNDPAGVLAGAGVGVGGGEGEDRGAEGRGAGDEEDHEGEREEAPGFGFGFVDFEVCGGEGC